MIRDLKAREVHNSVKVVASHHWLIGREIKSPRGGL